MADAEVVARIGRGWARFTTVVMAAIFFQAVTAGRSLDGDHWARTTHRAVGGLLVLAVLAAGVVAFVALRERAGGRRIGTMLISLATALVLQYGLGAAAADGRGTLWLHIPIGVATVGMAAQTNRLARGPADPEPDHSEGSQRA